MKSLGNSLLLKNQANHKLLEIQNRYLYQGKELQDDLGLEIYDFHARAYDPVLGRTWQIDPHAENFLSESLYSFLGNNPINMVDPIGKDYGLVIDHDKKTVTITTTYYVKTGDEKSLKSATASVGTWNENNGGMTYKVGKGEGAMEYAVNFDFKVKEVDNPKGEFMNDRKADVADADKSTPDKSSNVYEVVSNNDKDVSGDTHGVTRGDNYVKVRQSDADNTTGAHEMGHTLGLNHSQSGLMTEGQNSSSHSSSISNWNAQDVIKGGLKGNGISTVTSSGQAPDNFNKGRVKYKNP